MGWADELSGMHPRSAAALEKSSSELRGCEAAKYPLCLSSTLYRVTNDNSPFSPLRRVQHGVLHEPQRTRICPFGSQAGRQFPVPWPMALRPRLSSGLPLSGNRRRSRRDLESLAFRLPVFETPYSKHSGNHPVRRMENTACHRVTSHRNVALHRKPMSPRHSVKLKNRWFLSLIFVSGTNVAQRQHCGLFAR
jgi:hypothetical protein